MPYSLPTNLFGQLAKQLPRRAEAMLRDAADATVIEVGRALTETKHGAQYPDLPRRSSAPGEAPATQSGDLEASYATVPVDSAQVNVESDVEYAAELELGSIDGTVAPRPALAPAVRSVGAQSVQRALKVILTEHGR